ncbi:GNAT family N-acetyltransferase [Paenibacillus sp. S150]|uniref:GNAT family N-acetyltransferase n=1 Tax=Paenibacillus sp. S150 TaxID=2749826 RepID=UPI001C57116B|nr:GNAT family N-acetyltransferase [Paenibacillus sp. S150]MBW4080384.1 GNAT family N-acetyltransferase [Paenibacillus sp. S150]
MIRKLGEADREPLMALLRKDPALNLYIIGDVENFGFEQDFMELWGEICGRDGRLKAVLLRFYGSFLPYADGPFDAAGFAGLMKASRGFETVSGSAEAVKAVARHLNVRTEKHMHFAELREPNDTLLSAAASAQAIKKATPADVDDICSLTDQIAEFSSSADASRKSLRKTLETGTGRTYYMEHNGQVISTASTAAENSMSAMIIAVATHPAYRGQGLAGRVAARLSADMLAEGKSLCLFYDNPQAGLIYRKLGYQDIGCWSMLYM